MRGQKLGGELPPSFFFIVSGSKLCKRPQGHRMSRGSACDGSRESVTSHGDSLVSPLFRRCPPTNSLHPCSLLKEKKRGYLRNFLSEKEKMEKEIFKCFLLTKKRGSQEVANTFFQERKRVRAWCWAIEKPAKY